MQKLVITGLTSVWHVLGVLLWVTLSSQQGRADVTVSNPYAAVNWSTVNRYKGNLHTHSTQSDGTQPVATVLDGYDAQNYDVLAMTDHNLVTYPWTTWGKDPVTLGMTDIQANELSSGHHTLSFFCGYASTSTDQTTLLAGVANAGGISAFAHPGRYTYAASWYTNHYRAHPTCIGQEVYNQGDRYTNDRVLWDQVLTLLMPTRPVWGFSNDDSHAASDIGLNRTYLLAPTRAHTDIRAALTNGAFFATYSTSSSYTPPMLTNVVVNATAGTITVQGTGYTQVRWISQGTQVATGETLDLATAGVAKYVRAELHGTQGISYSNPFGLLPTGNQRPSVGAGSDQAITLPAGATLSGTASDDGLPNPPAMLTLLWEKVSGPGTVTFTNVAVAQTAVTFGAAGTYVLRLTASDSALSASDEVTVTVSATGGPTGWTAYNDCSWASGQLSTRITTFGLNQSGVMVDYATGTTLPVSIQVTNNPSAPANANGTGGPMPNSGTDAYNTFNGIISFANVIYYGNTGWWVDAVITGLDPNRRYEFATSVNRGSSSYTTRWSKFTISGVDASTQSSTAGVQVNSSNSVSFWSGYNNVNGHVARWTEIRPGSDGTFKVRAEADGQLGHATKEAYAFDGILLRDLGPASVEPVNQAPLVNAGSDETILLATNVTLNGTVSDDGLPTPPATLTLLWEKVSGPGTVAFTNTAAAQTPVTFGAAGTYVLRLTANDSELSASDEITVTVLASLPGIQVGPTGSGVQSLDSLPPASEWASSSLSTGKDGFTTAAGLDAGVQALNQSAVAETLVSDTSADPLKRNRAVWSSGGSKFIQLSSTTVGAVLLKGTLVNKSGKSITSLRVAYDYTVVETSAEEVPGLRVFYSLTGQPNSWMLIPSLSGSMTTQTYGVTVPLVSPWVDGSQLFLLWADDNSVADTERKYRIDNFSVRASTQGTVILFNF